MVVLLGAVAYLASSPPTNPVVDGKPLRVWIAQFSIWQFPPPQDAAKALRGAGPRAEPLLRSMLRSRDTWLKIKLEEWAAKQKLVKFAFDEPAFKQHQEALAVCNLLGESVFPNRITSLPLRSNPKWLVSRLSYRRALWVRSTSLY